MERDGTGTTRMNELSGAGGAKRSRRLPGPALGLLLGLAVLAPAGQAHEVAPDTLAARVERATRAAARITERGERAAARANERTSRRQRRAAEHNARHEARRKTRESHRLTHKEKEGNTVAIDCTKVTIAYHGFPALAGRPNDVHEWIKVKNPPESISKGPITFPELNFAFEGATGTHVVHIPFPVGHYLIDVHAKWNTNAHKGGFDIHGNVTCSPAPAYTITKAQSISGSGLGPTGEPLSGKVGQVIDYRVTITNTGNTPLTFSRFADPRCDPGSIAGGSLTPIEPLGTLTYTCAHTLTAADQTAGPYVNVATVSGTPEQNEGATITHQSNAVVVDPLPPAATQEEQHEEKPAEKPAEKHEEPKPKTETPQTAPLGGGSLPASPIGSTGKGGVLGFTSAAIPSLRGPQGCVRKSFLVSIRAKGVSSVIFFIDGHRLSKLTARNARHDLLSIRINPAKLRVGVHRLLAQITMKQGATGVRAARATRRLIVIRCASSAVVPKFTG